MSVIKHKKQVYKSNRRRVTNKPKSKKRKSSHRTPQKRNYKRGGGTKTVTWRGKNDVYGTSNLDTDFGRFRYLNTSPSTIRNTGRHKPLSTADVITRMTRQADSTRHADEPKDWWDTEKYGDTYTETSSRVRRAARHNH